MKTIHLALIIPVLFSGCVQPESTSRSLRSTSAGPLTVASDRDTSEKTRKTACTTSDANENVSQIGEGAEALFQVLKQDLTDLNTIHDRAGRLSDLEKAYAGHFVDECLGTGVTSENVSLRIEKLDALVKENDAAVIQILAHEIWDLFNPNLEVRGDVGQSSGNPFPVPATL